ncbi:DNA polymerase theta [Frankliniella fusca]|uniref:DNA polymerase theta n=1 Tax=Frankliniella fusca TaxID=407009 RepID=A0AAE1HAW8_9NEOP|nr:DNA polymerase theta [Frankliniella fusca]
MADEFPEDSFFRNSNVAVLEAVIQEREDATVTKSNVEISLGRNKSSEHDAAQQAFGNGSESSKLNSVTCKEKLSNTRKRKTTKTIKKSIHSLENETTDDEVVNTQRSETSAKDKNKNHSYRPLNITRNVLVLPKSNSLSTLDYSLPPKELSGICNETEQSADSLLSTQQKLKLEAWGLPQNILMQYAKRGITEMFPWQLECLSWKTLVSEIICIKTVLERRKKAIFVLPFVSVVREKMFYFQDIFRGSRVRVDGFMGGHSPPGGFKSLDLAVCTIEKANSLVNRLMEEKELATLGAVVVDELHLLGDPHRGYLLELLLTKLKYMTLRKSEISVQIVGMSATLPNLSLLSTWLCADLYKTTFRPVPLEEFIKIGNSMYDNNLKLVRTIEPEVEIKNDTEGIVYLCLETITNGHSVLIFCPTKAWCESLAQTVACEFRTVGLSRNLNAPESLPYKLREQLNADKIAECLEQLKNCPVGLDSLLGRVVSFGVAYHHAGLSMDERDILEGCFKNGTLRVLIATTTLSSGVNLPARRVIIRSPSFQGRPIDVLSYRQMVGRAGRMGVDSAGESIIICQKSEQRIVTSLVCSSLKPIESCLGHGDLSASLKRAVLEVIASKVATTPEDLELYTNCTLLAASRLESESKVDPVSSCIAFLQENELIRLQVDDDGILRYSPTPLGEACLSASIHPDEGLRLFQELQRARQCFVLENELHLVTPLNVADQWGNIDWMHVLALWEQLSPDLRRVGELVGVEDRFIVRAMRGTVNLRLEKQRQKLMVHRRFYTALALHDLVNEVPLNKVAAKFNCSRGMLQSLQQSAATYAGMVTSFCHRLGWSSVELLVDQFQDRLHFGTHRELLDLLKVPSLNGPRARALYNAGITCLTELTMADLLAVENALLASIPFSSEKGRDGETTSESERRRKLKGIWVTGRQGLTEREAAELLVKEARLIVQAELGLAEVNWSQRQRNEENSLCGTIDHPSGKNTSNTDIIPVNGKDSAVELLRGEGKTPGDETEKVEVLSLNSEKTDLNVPRKNITTINFIGHEEESYNSGSFEFDIESSKVAKNMTTHSFELKSTTMQNLGEEVGETERTSLNFESFPNSPLCPLDNNICDTSNLSESSFPTSNKATPKSLSVTDSKHLSPNVLQASVDNMFGSSFPNSALHNILENNVELTDTVQTASTDLFQNSVNAPFCPSKAVVNNSLESWGISVSTLHKLCAEEEDFSKKSQQIKEKPLKNTPSPKRLSLDLFASCQEENESVTLVNQDGEVQESEDLFNSPTSSICNRILKDKSWSKSQSHFKENNANTELENSGSPSLFGDSFEINTGLLDVLDGRAVVLAGVPETKPDPTERKVTQFLECEQAEQRTTADSAEQSFSSKAKRCREMKHKFLGTGKKTRVSVNSEQSPGEEMKSQMQAARNSVMSRSNNLHLGLSRRVLAKRSAVQEETRDAQKTAVEDSSAILTDSFLEAAFETAFHSHSDVSVSCLKDKSPLSSHENKIEICESSDDDVVLSPPKRMKQTPLRDSAPLHSGGNMESVKKHGVQFSKNLRSKKPLKISENANVIGPPLTRRMLANRQKCCLKTEEGKTESIPLKIDVGINSNQNWNPFPSIPVEDWSTYNVVDVCRSKVLFRTFSKEVLNTTVWSVSLSCEPGAKIQTSEAIGNKILKSQKPSRQDLKAKLASDFSFENCALVGVSFCFGGTDAYYLSLADTDELCAISVNDKLQLLKKIFCQNEKINKPLVCCFDMKEQFKLLFRCTGIRMLNLLLSDPKVADWLLEPEGKEKTFQSMVLKYVDKAVGLAEHAACVRQGIGSPALDVEQPYPGRQRSSVEAILCFHIMSIQYQRLQDLQLLSSFLEVEMPVITTVAGMELAGIGFSSAILQTLQEKLLEEMSSLESKAYQLAGRSFSLTSPSDTARVLYQELKLGKGQSLKGRRKNTSKETLTKLKSEHELPNIILLWRKLSAIYSKTVCPLLPTKPCTRLFGRYIMHTATGRISMYEPNIQCIPRDFGISSHSKEQFCMRAAFVASADSVLVAADYSQLELRLLAHLSGEPKLKDILKSGEDVFCNLAASWNNITCDKVTDELRQKAKQLCYGIIYGMGTRALADQLGVDETDAESLMESFHNCFPGIRNFMEKTISECRDAGYVKTILNRRRYLPGISSSSFHVRAHAERQAVNTTIQGSAADLTKSAMIAVEKEILKIYHSFHIKKKDNCPSAPQLVLHLHDELMYEVPIENVNQFCKLLKTGMETAIHLSVELPVKVKVGKSWGELNLRIIE